MNKLLILPFIFIFLISCSNKRLTTINRDFNSLPHSEVLNKVEKEIESIFKVKIEEFIVFKISESATVYRAFPQKSMIYVIYKNSNLDDKYEDRIFIYKYFENNWIKLNNVSIDPDFINKIAYNLEFICDERLNGLPFEFDLWIRYNNIDYINCYLCYGLLPTKSKLDDRDYSIKNYLFNNLFMCEIQFLFKN